MNFLESSIFQLKTTHWANLKGTFIGHASFDLCLNNWGYLD